MTSTELALCALRTFRSKTFPFHARKYGPFGLSFRKSFLVGKGASPVFYVAKQSATDWRNPLANDPTNFAAVQALAKASRNRGGWWNFTRAELYDEADQALFTTERTRQAAESEAEGLGIVTIHQFLAHELFPFLKFFDADLAEDDPNNFYVEREWRVIGPVRFELVQVERILLPRAFAAELKKQMPEFHGQLTFVEPHCDAK